MFATAGLGSNEPKVCPLLFTSVCICSHPLLNILKPPQPGTRGGRQLICHTSAALLGQKPTVEVACLQSRQLHLPRLGKALPLQLQGDDGQIPSTLYILEMFVHFTSKSRRPEAHLFFCDHVLYSIALQEPFKEPFARVSQVLNLS